MLLEHSGSNARAFPISIARDLPMFWPRTLERLQRKVEILALNHPAMERRPTPVRRWLNDAVGTTRPSE